MSVRNKVTSSHAVSVKFRLSFGSTIEAGKRGRRAQLIRSKTVTVKERLELMVLPKKRVEDSLGSQGGRHRQIAARHTLGDREKIRLHTLLLTGKRSPRPAKARHDFVSNQQRAIALHNLRDVSQVTGRVRNHARRALHQWLNDEGGVGIATALTGEGQFHRRHALPLAFDVFPSVATLRLCAIKWASVAVRRPDLVGCEEQARVCFVKQVDMSQADRADSIAVIRAIQ